MDAELPVIFLMGPTASGKTGLAVRLCETLPVELVSVDSALVYRGMDIGTAKPDAALLEKAPHRLIDIRDPAQPYSAAAFCADARHEIRQIHAAGRLPLLVGGTMLYFKALRDGLSETPEADPVVREKILGIAKRSGWEAVHRRLAEVDPASAARLKPTDAQRLQRALEVYEVSGRSLTDFWERSDGVPGLSGPLLQFGLVPSDRAVLHHAIEQRFDDMLEQGFQAEVEGLMARTDLHSGLPSMRAVGYRQMWEYLSDDAIDFGTMRMRAVAATRQLAKRQLTWLRGWENLQELVAGDSASFDHLAGQIRRFAEQVAGAGGAG